MATATQGNMPRPTGGPILPNPGGIPYAPTTGAGGGGGSVSMGGGSVTGAGGFQIPQGSPFSPGYGLGVPSQVGYGGSGPFSYPNPNMGPGWTGAGGGPILGGGPFSVEQPISPNFTYDMTNYLGSNIGQGVSPFSLPTALPFGGTTAPGQLNAPADPTLTGLENFYQGGQSSMPGANTLATIANQGISALPEWQAMVQAMGQNTSQNQANLAEQFGSMGNLAGSPFGTAMSNYMQGVNANQNSLLGQLQQQNILQGQIPTAEGLLSGGQQFGQYAQGLAQQNIQNMMNEYIRTSPQYNPLLGLQYGMSTTYDPVLQRPLQQGGGVLGGIVGALPGILGGIASL